MSRDSTQIPNIELDQFGRTILSEEALNAIENSINTTQAGANSNYFTCPGPQKNDYCTNWTNCTNSSNSICTNKFQCGGASNGYCQSVSEPGPGDP